MALPMTRNVTTAEIRTAALGLLARREHARKELVDKIHRRFSKRRDVSVDAAEIAAVVSEMAYTGLQSDARYLESFVRQRKQRGVGPRRILQELKQKGALDDAASALLETVDDEWKDSAREVRIRKFGEQLPATPREKARQMRFLQYRGFKVDQIRAALCDAHGCED